MVALYKLKALSLRLCYSQSSRITFLLGDLKRSHFDSPLPSRILCRRLTSKISETQPNFTFSYLINSCGLSPKGAISASKWFVLQSPERADSVLSFLRSHGFSATQISKILRSCPQLLHSNPDKRLLPKLEFLASLGFSREDLAKIPAYYPQFFTMSLEKRIVPTFNFLMSMISEKNVVSVIKRGSWSWILYSKNLVPNIEMLRESGMPQSCISVMLVHTTKALTLKPKQLGEVVDEVKRMGFNLQKPTSVLAIRALCGANSESIWNRSRLVYKRWGWSEDDLLSAFRRYPNCMTKSEKKIMQVMDFLVNKMGWQQRSIVKFPTVMSLSLESRIIPRCSVVKVLVLKGLIKEIENVSLSSVLAPAEKCFLEKFVSRYIDKAPQLLGVYKGKVEVQDV